MSTSFDKNIKRIQDINQSIQTLYFKNQGIFINSLVDNLDTTLLLRDIQADELELFKNKTIHQILYEKQDDAIIPNTTNTADTTSKNDMELCKLLDIQPNDLIYPKFDRNEYDILINYLDKLIIRLNKYYNLNLVSLNYKKNVESIHDRILNNLIEIKNLSEIKLPVLKNQLVKVKNNNGVINVNDLISLELNEIQLLEDEIKALKKQ